MSYHQVARLFRDGTLTGMSDRLILERYAERRDEVAFETLLARHGPMVLNICRQILRDPHDIDDAFQATFLALIRKAGSIRIDESLGPWLHTVANRIAMRARTNRLRREAREFARELLPEQQSSDLPDRLETPRMIHEELGHLPERLRAPIVLCYLEGMTQEMAASQLGCPVGTVRSRLARARVILHRRMMRRGLSLSTGVVVALLESRSKADVVPIELRKSLIMVAMRLASETATGPSAVGLGVSASAVALLEGILNVMRIKTLIIATAGLASVGISMAVIGTTGLSVAGQPDQQPAPVFKREERPEPSSLIQHIESVNSTYPVGDLILPRSNEEGNPRAPIRFTNMMPLIAMISSTVDPGPWRIFNDRGQDVSAELIRWDRSLKREMPQPVGTITPFFLSMSLVIRTSEENHKKVANLLRGLRRIENVRNNPDLDVLEEEDRFSGPTKPQAEDRRDSRLSPAAVKTLISAKDSGSRARIDQLLEQLRQEIAKLPGETVH